MAKRLCQECGLPILGRPEWFKHEALTGGASYPFCSIKCRQVWRLRYLALIAEARAKKAEIELERAENEAI